MPDAAPQAQLPFVSIVMPARNEEAFIVECLRSLLDMDYPSSRRELLVVDGCSTDGTVAAVRQFAREHPEVRLIENPKRITPAAINRGVFAARGEVILRVDAHARYPAQYLRELVSALDTYQADMVGSVMITRPRRDTLLGRAIVAALTHPFGVGNSHFRTGTKEPRVVDTLFGGAYRRATIERTGLFNEDLPFSQDIEFNLRIKRWGGKVLLIPSVSCEYFARSDLRSFSAHNFRNGLWVVLPFLYSSIMPVTWKHLVPLAWVTVLLSFAMSAAFVPSVGLPALGVTVGAYLLAAVAAGIAIARRQRDVRLALVMPLIFCNLHFLYGAGSLVAVVAVAIGWGRRRLRSFTSARRGEAT